MVFLFFRLSWISNCKETFLCVYVTYWLVWCYWIQVNPFIMYGSFDLMPIRLTFILPWPLSCVFCLLVIPVPCLPKDILTTVIRNRIWGVNYRIKDRNHTTHIVVSHKPWKKLRFSSHYLVIVFLFGRAWPLKGRHVVSNWASLHGRLLSAFNCFPSNIYPHNNEQERSWITNIQIDALPYQPRLRSTRLMYEDRCRGHCQILFHLINAQYTNL